jgi:hypothetical protein
MSLRRVIVWCLRARCEKRAGDFPGCDQLLGRARLAIRAGKLDLAEAFVMEGGDMAWRNAACLNVLALVAEARNDWQTAARLWRRSIRADRTYQPPRRNLRRFFELLQFGCSSGCVVFGDEAAEPRSLWALR